MSLTNDDLNAIKGVVQPMIDKLDEDLSIRTANGFDEVDKSFEKVNRKLNDIEVAVNKIDSRSFATADKVDDHEVRITKLEKQPV